MSLSEVILVTCSKESGGGMACLDVHLASTTGVCSNFKNCIADAHGLCVVSGSSSYSGQGSAGDYIVASQSKKPMLNVYQWGKPQPHQQCHIQEITTSLACDSTGTYILGGTKKGWIYCWEVGTGALLTSWQAHFKSVTKILFTPCGHLAVSCSEDGMARAWDVATLVQLDSSAGKKKTTHPPFRSWSPHTLAVKDMALCGTATTALRALTCSIDRTLVVFDVHANRQCFRLAMDQPMESLACNRTEDLVFLGATNGQILIVDLSVAAAGMTAAHAQVVVSHDTQTRPLAGASGSVYATRRDKPHAVLDGHTRSVTALACSVDNCTLVSGSEDGSVRVWDMWTRQCLRESKPLHKAGITSLLLLRRPEILSAGGVHKPLLVSIEHLKKYADTATAGRVVLPPKVLGAHVYHSAARDVDLKIVARASRRGEAPDAEEAHDAAPAAHVTAATSSGSSGSGGKGGAAVLTSEEDFVAFSTSEMDGAAWSEAEQPLSSNGSTGGSAEELRSRIAALESDCERWKSVAVGLKRKMEEEQSWTAVKGKSQKNK